MLKKMLLGTLPRSFQEWTVLQGFEGASFDLYLSDQQSALRKLIDEMTLLAGLLNACQGQSPTEDEACTKGADNLF